MLQANIRALLLRSVESWVGIQNIMGYLSIADRRTLVSIWSHNRNRSQTIADDRRRSQKIEHGSIFCDRLRSRSQDRRRSQKCVSIWSQTIAELFAICDPRSAIVCDHMETSLNSRANIVIFLTFSPLAMCEHMLIRGETFSLKQTNNTVLMCAVISIKSLVFFEVLCLNQGQGIKEPLCFR